MSFLVFFSECIVAGDPPLSGSISLQLNPKTYDDLHRSLPTPILKIVLLLNTFPRAPADIRMIFFFFLFRDSPLRFT